MIRKRPRTPNTFLALLPIVFLTGSLTLNVFLFEDALGGPNQIALLLAATLAAGVSVHLGNSWEHIQKSITASIHAAMPSIIILLLIGALSGTWMISGVVPAMIYYGLKLLNPTYFLVFALLICSIVSVATGSSWSTIATVGVALIGIGNAMGIHPGISAGAIISGAYFGDKMSPLSDTTNLAPAMAGADLFTHVRYMALTTTPSYIITLIIFLVIGLFYTPEAPPGDVEAMLGTLDHTFNINVWLFLVPVILVVVIVRKMPAMAALLTGALLGGIFALIFQPDIIRQLGQEGSFAKRAYVVIIQAMSSTTAIQTPEAALNELLTTSGMQGMLGTIWLILTAMIFGGAMESAGLLVYLTRAIVARVERTGSLIASTVLTCIFFNVTASDQYISIVVPGRMYARVYRRKGLKPEVLSRTLEDAGTVTSVLVPWNTCGATQSGVLGVAVTTYLPYSFFCLISPIMSILFGFLNIRIRRFPADQIPDLHQENELHA